MTAGRLKDSSVRLNPLVGAAPGRFREWETMHTIRARFARGALKPLETLDLDEGQEVTVSIVDRTPTHPGRGMRAAAGAWKGTHDPERLKREIYAARRLTSRPRPDL
jgi:predicted DNA-binding antitoxin AbrB/MazE fold protein